jgi:uncharacterized protein (TIGR03435 family)
MKFRILAAAAISTLVLAQEPAHLQFEVASIKPNHSGDMRVGIAMEPGGRFVATNVPVKMLILMAYQLKDNQLSGLPGWADGDRFDITAKPESGSGIKQDDERAMIQALLAERFKLTFHKETKELPIYALVVAKGGPKMEPSKGNADFGDETRARSADAGRGPGRGRGGQGIRMMRGEINGANITVEMLADQLSRITGRSVIDKTGLSGSYDFNLKYTPEGNMPMPKGPDGAEAPSSSDAERPSIFVAVQEQLGLKLESQKGPVDLYIIERLEKPSDN